MISATVTLQELHLSNPMIGSGQNARFQGERGNHVRRYVLQKVLGRVSMSEKFSPKFVFERKGSNVRDNISTELL